MTESNSTYNKIELRSEKVRNIIGTVPSTLVHWGIAVTAIIFLALMIVAFFAPYPYGEGETILQHLLGK